MTLSKWKLRKIVQSMRVCISKTQEAAILRRFGAEPEPYEWSVQDIHVQIGNYLHCGHWEKPSIICEPGEPLPEGIEF